MKKLFVLLIVLGAFVAQAFAQWEWQNPTPQGNTLNSVYFTNINTGYAAGKCGTIIKTTDGGVSWTVQNSGTANHLHSILFPLPDIGYAAGENGIILKTTDGGNNWAIQNYSTPSGQLSTVNSLFFINADTGYAAGGTSILKTTDGGTNWQRIYRNTNININTLFFLSADTGWLAGGSGVIME